jgi:hypothetical protein
MLTPAVFGSVCAESSRNEGNISNADKAGFISFCPRKSEIT